MNRLALALEYLKKMGLPQKDVSAYLNIPASTLSYKKKNSESDDDPLLSRIEAEFEIEYNETSNTYTPLDIKKLHKKIKDYTYGKAIEYIGTHWYLYFYYGKSPLDRGLGKAVVHIWEQYKVEIKNLPDEEGRIRDYFGTFELDKSESYLILNLFDARTRDKNLHIKFAIGMGSRPTLALGHYSNIGENHKLDARNVILTLSEDAPKDMKSEKYIFGKEDYLAVNKHIRRFLLDKDKNCLRIPQTIIKSHRALKNFFDSYDIERSLSISDHKLKKYGGESLENAKSYYVYHLDSAPESLNKLCAYKMKVWKDYEQTKYLAQLESLNKHYESWQGEVTRYESYLNFIFQYTTSKYKCGYAFLQAHIPNKNHEEHKSFFLEGILTGMQYTGNQLLSFRVLILDAEYAQSEESQERVKTYFDKFKNEPNNIIRVNPSLDTNFDNFIKN